MLKKIGFAMKAVVKPMMRLLGVSLLVAACPPTSILAQQPCRTEIVAGIDLRELKLTPPPAWVVEDPLRDYILDHPLFKENFDVVYESYKVIPTALDIVSVEVALDGDKYYFCILTAGGNVLELLQEGRHSARFGVYLDRDLNGYSDVLLTTTDRGPERGIVITPDFEVIEDMPRLTIEDNSVTMRVSRETVGDHFDWVVFSGYSPREDAYYRTPLEEVGVFVVPEVDITYPNPERTVLVHTVLSGSGPSCRVTGMGVTICPPPGKPPNNPPGRRRVPGSSCEGWMYQRTQCDNLGYELWCNCSVVRHDQYGNPYWHYGEYGKRVFKGSASGWVAKCPFVGGLNGQGVQDTDGDSVPDRIMHTVVDGYGDDDNDGKEDVMVYDYSFLTNKVTSCHIERSYQTGVVLDEKWLPPTPPYTDPASVPGPHIIQ